MSETSNIVLMKLARRREMEELAKGNLSDADIKRLQANNAGMKHEKLIKPLGTGATMQGDLVMHPKHGIVVRKSMAKAPRSVDRIRYAPDISIYQDIKEVQDRKGSMGFARVREVTPEGIVFQDLAEGKSILKERLEADEAFQKAKPKYDRATRKRERLVKKGLKTPADRKAYNAALKEQGAVYQDIRAGYDRAMAPLKDKEFDKSQRKFIKLLKKRWPGAWDYGAGQNVNKTPSGKMTMFDMSSGRGGPTLGSTGDTRFDQFRERAQGLHADAKPTRTNFFKNVSKIQRQKFISNAMPILVPLGTGAVTLGLMYGLNKLNNSLGKKKPMKKTASQIADVVLEKQANLFAMKTMGNIAGAAARSADDIGRFAIGGADDVVKRGPGLLSKVHNFGRKLIGKAPTLKSQLAQGVPKGVQSRLATDPKLLRSTAASHLGDAFDPAFRQVVWGGVNHPHSNMSQTAFTKAWQAAQKAGNVVK